MCLVQTRHQILCILHRLNLHLKEGWVLAGEAKKAPAAPADADVRWTVEGGWGGEGETHAEQKMKIWFLLSLGLLSLSAGDQERSGGECLAESAVDVRRDLFQRRQ